MTKNQKRKEYWKKQLSAKKTKEMLKVKNLIRGNKKY